MKIGIIGFGSIGKRHYENLQKYKVEIVVLTKRTDLNFVKSVATWEDFAAAGPFTAIFVTNETAKHLETVYRAIELKPRALFVEKPLSKSKEGLAMLAQKIEKNSISVWVGYNFHFFTPFLRIKEIIQSGKLGKIYYLRVAVGQDLSEWRQRDYRKSYSSKVKEGGGVVLDLVHDINYPAWLLNEELLARACQTAKISDLEIDTEDWSESILESKSGIKVSVHQDYIRVPYRRYMEICGSEASISWDSDSNKILLKDGGGVIIEEEIKEDRNAMYEREIEFFVKSLKANISFSNLEEAIHDVKLIEELKKYASK